MQSRTRLLRTSQSGWGKELQLLLDFGTTCRLAFYEKKPHTESDLRNPVDGVENSQQSRCGVKATRSVASLDVIAFWPLPGLVLKARSGDLRDADKRHCNPHVLPFHHFSFEHFDGYWGNCSAYRFLSSEEGFSTRLGRSSSKCFTKRWIVMFATALQNQM